LEEALMLFLIPLLGYSKLDYQRNVDIKEKTEGTKHSRRNSNIPEELERTRHKDARWETTKISS
jgi:hypothetical protein